ncbi:hypothetical protein SAMD00019534_044050 [Acytostelium subglobosum LB1]|uniref:hypothetical protein n=1 Tax=Acytostelium subglobosum LB1 TaxID=1410327 RepID=UPI000644C406|nr:hypothetical protein SAMD00019534_044050 [Acytostelium subglobosum LB1]GAM21230.1 hypothetical protein SAMD00019534_044050 [Acytostelium subglobosum LB1]|eukprot:XP_012755349.1 hypothetical protein SAMD00019534_044050 [Acytostelium subglobosum LB1]
MDGRQQQPQQSQQHPQSQQHQGKEIIIPSSTSLESTSKLFVGGLSKTTTSDTLKSYFGQFGEVRDATIIESNEKSQRSRGFGFVTFVYRETVDLLLQRPCNHVIDDKNVEVRLAMPKSESTTTTPYDPSSSSTSSSKKVQAGEKLFIGNLPRDITEDMLVQYFRNYGELANCKIIVEESKKTFGFVSFKDSRNNPRVLSMPHHLINGKKIGQEQTITKSSGCL